jgi:Ca2+-binding RTX toxin-like protein
VYLFDADTDLGSDAIHDPDTSGADRISFYRTTDLPVVLNLGIHTPQQVNANLQLTLWGIEQVTGSAQDDILVSNRPLANVRFWGGKGNDVLVGRGNTEATESLNGQNGRDILIGGTAIDTLIGGHGTDFLIGGSTAYDNDVTALQSLMAEWASSNSYKIRISHLTGASSGGLNGDYTLHGGPDATVFDDGYADVLTGNDYYDWFLGKADEPTDKVAGERLTII